MGIGAVEQGLHQVFDLLGNVPVQDCVAALGAKGYRWNAGNGDDGVAMPVDLGGKLTWDHLIIAY